MAAAAAALVVSLPLALAACSTPPGQRAAGGSTAPATTGTTRPPASTLPATALVVRSVSAPTAVSTACSGSSAEVENAVDPARGYVYEAWIGCGGIGFARSLDGGLAFGPPLPLPGSTRQGANRIFSWDPAIAVAPGGTVYASFMVSEQDRDYPVVDVSTDHGATFRVSPLRPAQPGNFGDRDFVAVDGAGHVYVSWDYDPSRANLKTVCAPGGSCGFTAGEVNMVVQESSDGGRTFGPILHVGPGFPRDGGDAGPLVVDPSGQVDLVYQRHTYPGPALSLGPSALWFADAGGFGRPWSPSTRLGSPALTMSGTEWWIDGDVAADAAGNLYATWDTQSPTGDVGWLDYSTDHGRSWAPPRRVTPDTDAAPHVVQVVGGAAGVAYVAWLTDAPAAGYALYVRAFKLAGGWASPPVQVSRQFGAPSVWPGDTFGISLLPGRSAAAPSRLALTWGSGVRAAGTPLRGEIWAAVATLAA